MLLQTEFFSSVSSTLDQDNAGISLRMTPESALLDWIPDFSNLCAVRLDGYFRANSNRLKCCCLLVESRISLTTADPLELEISTTGTYPDYFETCV